MLRKFEVLVASNCSPRAIHTIRNVRIKDRVEYEKKLNREALRGGVGLLWPKKRTDKEERAKKAAGDRWLPQSVEDDEIDYGEDDE